MFFVSVYRGTHVVGGTKAGCNFLHKAGFYIPYSFMGFLSSPTGINIICITVSDYTHECQRNQ